MEPARPRPADPGLGRDHRAVAVATAFGSSLYSDDDRRIVDAVAKIAESRGVSRAQVALAWVLRQPAVTAPIVGATKPHHLEDAIAAVDLELSDDEAAQLEGPYSPREPAGF